MGKLLLPWREASLLVQESDSATTKFEGALVNALIVVAAVTGMTFILFLLYKYRVRMRPLCNCNHGSIAYKRSSLCF